MTFELQEAFEFDVNSYERQANGKGEMVNRGQKKIQSIKYTPDFISPSFIIECKGRANESFPIRWKMFKKFVKRSNVGYKKYGSTLDDERRFKMKDLQGYLNDIQEELMDAILYIQTAREELRDLSEEAMIDKFRYDEEEI